MHLRPDEAAYDIHATLLKVVLAAIQQHAENTTLTCELTSLWGVCATNAFLGRRRPFVTCKASQFELRSALTQKLESKSAFMQEYLCTSRRELEAARIPCTNHYTRNLLLGCSRCSLGVEFYYGVYV